MPCTAAARLGLILSVLTCLALPAQAQWMWRDDTGRITVSDLPPPRGTPEANILQRPEVVAPAPRPAAAGSASAAKPVPPVPPAVDPELQARKQAAEQQRTEQAKAEADKLTAQRAQNCRNARNHLVALDSGQRMARVNDKGEREVMDDRMRADAARQAREVVASDCR